MVLTAAVSELEGFGSESIGVDARPLLHFIRTSGLHVSRESVTSWYSMPYKTFKAKAVNEIEFVTHITDAKKWVHISLVVFAVADNLDIFFSLNQQNKILRFILHTPKMIITLVNRKAIAYFFVC